MNASEGMNASSIRPCVRLIALCLLGAVPSGFVYAQTGSSLPPTAPTGAAAPIAAVATTADRAGAPRHHAEVICTPGRLEVRADNSSLNGILRSIARCTGMKITGGVVDQRVFGDYGPAAAATVLATLLDGTGSNMLLLETAANEPSELVLTPRTGGPTPPGPGLVPDDDVENSSAAAAPRPGPMSPAHTGYMGMAQPARPVAQPGNTTATGSSASGSGVTTLPSMPPPINNVLGSPGNTSPTASTYPTTNSVPLDSLPTPYTTPSPSGIVDAPNPPPAGSDTAKLLKGQTTNMPGNTTITSQPTTGSTQPGATNTAVPATSAGAGSGTTPTSGGMTPEQVSQKLRQLQQEKQQGQSPTNPAPQ